MTRDEILKMPAGRELDALVATKVLGYTYDPESWVEWGITSPDGNREGELFLRAYSTDIAAALEVVEKMRGDNWRFGCSSREFGTGDNWWAWLENPPHWESSDTKSATAEADTLPLAICRAALLAMLDGDLS